MKKIIVISAVNIRKGGTLTILKDCLKYCSGLTAEYRIIAIVHKKEPVFFKEIEYIEIPWAINTWIARLWCEYVTMNKLSKKITPVFLWLSLHDTSPRVKAERQAVYCQTAFPFYKWSWQDFRFDYKIPLFSLLTKYAYRINIYSNKYLIVQQEWLRGKFSAMFKIDLGRFIVMPARAQKVTLPLQTTSYCRSFLYPATPDCHKNFELLCRATELLETELGNDKFKVTITIKGNENKYAAWLYEQWKHVKSLNFEGFMNKSQLYEYYKTTDCLVFPSKIETWGLPISEFMEFGKPMLLANLPYAYETAAGSHQTAFFDPHDPAKLKDLMKQLITAGVSSLHKVPGKKINPPVAASWSHLFNLLLN